MNANSQDSSSQQYLSQAQLNAQGLLTEFALSEDFLSGIHTAFGDNFNQSTLEQFYQQWVEGNFDSFPEVEVRSASEINGANGAFSADTNKIYISREFLSGNNLDAITNLLLEEYGHYIDSHINFSDAPGDEGAIFSALARGERLDQTQLEQLKIEDDISIINLDNRNIEIEANNSEQNPGDYVKEHFDTDKNEIGFRVGIPILSYEIGEQPTDWLSNTDYTKEKVHNFRLKYVSEDSIVIGASYQYQKFQKNYIGGGVWKQAEYNADMTAWVKLTVSEDSEINVIKPPTVIVDKVSRSGVGIGFDLLFEEAVRVLTSIVSGGRSNVGFFEALAGLGNLGFNYTNFFNQISESFTDPIKKNIFDNQLLHTFVPYLGQLYELDANYNEVFLSDIRYDSGGVWFIFSYPEWLENLVNDMRSFLNLGLHNAESLGKTFFNGGFSNDDLSGSPGNDSLYGHSGNDTLQGESGNDSLYGGNDNDSLYGELGNDYLDGDSGNDLLDGFDGQDTLFGKDGDDTLYGGNDNDYVDGGNGSSTVTGSGHDSLFGGGGNDTLYGEDGDDSLYGGNDNDSLYGELGNDYLDGDSGNDLLDGFDGQDTLFGKDGDDTLYGGNDNDYVDGGNGSSTVTGSGHDSLFGGNGNDTLYGEDGDDSLYGGNDNDQLYGNEGLDELQGDDGNDSLYGGNDNDSLYGELGNDYLDGDSGNDLLDGFDGQDTLFGKDGDDTLYGGNDNDYVDGGNGSSTVTGSGHDSLFGGNGNDTLFGEDGNDSLYGGNHNDHLYGNDGDDTLIGGSGEDTIDGGEGIDTVSYETSENSSNIGISIALDGRYIGNFDGIDSLDQILNVENAIGSQYGDIIIGSDVGNTIRGEDGNDNLEGLGGNDQLEGNDGNDTLSSGLGLDDLLGGLGNDYYYEKSVAEAAGTTIYDDGGEDDSLLIEGLGNLEFFRQDSFLVVDINRKTERSICSYQLSVISRDVPWSIYYLCSMFPGKTEGR